MRAEVLVEKLFPAISSVVIRSQYPAESQLWPAGGGVVERESSRGARWGRKRKHRPATRRAIDDVPCPGAHELRDEECAAFRTPRRLSRDVEFAVATSDDALVGLIASPWSW